MDNTAKDYKKLYEQSLELLAEKENQLTGERKLLTQTKETLSQAISEKDEQINSLSFQLDRFRQYLYGKKSEKLTIKQVDLSQLNLFELGTSDAQKEELSTQAAEKPIVDKKPAKKRAKGTGRMKLPENLRREEIIIEPKEDVSDCQLIGEDITEVLDIIPPELYVKKYVRRKYARKAGEGIIMGSLPERVIEKGIPSESILANITIDKYVFGLPLHRQINKYRRLGINLPASTVSDWMIKTWRHLVPLWELLKLMVMNQKYLQADESPLKVLDRDHENGIHQGYMWIYNAPAENLVLFDYRKGRSAIGPSEMLKDFTGILQTDGYSVYESLFANHPKIILVYCMAHVRRKFVDALKYDEERATWVLNKIQLLYAIEQEMRDNNCTWKERTMIRQEKAAPILQEIKDWLKKEHLCTPPGVPLGQAINYALPRWKGLSAYVQHGQIEIDNNLAENAIRPIAIGRKNYLFAGSHQAAEMTAAMYSFTAMCKKNDVNEFEWLKDVLQRIQSHKQKDLYQLLPNNWKKYKK